MEEVEVKASQMGWKPKEEYKGPPDKWVDAEEYLRRGEEVLPIVRNENRRLHETVDALNKQIATLQSNLEENQTSMKEFAAFQADLLKTKLKEQRRGLLAEIREAREAGDDAKLVELEEQLDENRDATKAATAAPSKKPAAPGEPAKPPPLTAEQQAVYDAWASRNPWLQGTSEEDQAKQGAAMRFSSIATERGLRGQAFFDFIDEKMAKAFPAPTRTSKTEEGRPSGGNGAGGGKGYAALPPEAKATADAQAKSFVGPNKMFKTVEAWQKYYAEQFFGG